MMPQPVTGRFKAASVRGSTQSTQGEKFETTLFGRITVDRDVVDAADVVVGSLVSWSAFMGVLEGFPRVQEYLGRLVVRPAFVASQAE